MTREEFLEFRHKQCHAAIELQERLKAECKISKWPRWDYDFERGTLIFSEDGEQRVVAIIQVVGTTSEKDKNWEWSWANPNLPLHLKDKIERVREFGETEGIEELTTAFLPDDEYLGWEMTSIAAMLLGASGVYRCPGDGGFTYVIFTDVFWAGEKPLPEKKRIVKCDSDGAGYETFICEHLASNASQQWFGDEPTPDNPWPSAWCTRCNKLFEREGEWNDRNSADLNVKLLCHHCYERARNLALSRPN